MRYRTISLERPSATSLSAATFGILLAGASLVLSSEVRAQDQNSAVDATGTPVGVAEEGAAGGPEIVGTDGLIRYGNADEMWQSISSKWDTLGEQASERWSEIDEQQLMDTAGDKEQLVALVSERYDIPEAQAEQEVTAWATTADDGM